MFFLSAEKYIPIVDLGFALSASGVDATKNFEKMKSVINEIVDQYSIGRIRYGVVVYGDEARTRVGFQQVFANENDLKEYIARIGPASPGSNLDKGLYKGKELFETDSIRPSARKVLVVFTDNRSTGDEFAVNRLSKELKDEGIKVIAVALASESVLTELKRIATDGDHAIPAQSSDESAELANDIMTLAFKGKKEYSSKR